MKEEILKAINELPKVKSDNPISTMNGINVNDLMDAVERFDKVPTYQQLLEENKSLQSQLKAKEEVIKEAREYIKEHIRIDDEYPAYMEMLITERDELDEILSKGENK